MHKDQMTRGVNWLTGSLMMSVDPETAAEPSSLKEIADNFHNTLKSLSSSQAAVTYITPGGLTRPTIIATYFEQKKIPEKNGAQ
jgi:hypothetical protein